MTVIVGSRVALAYIVGMVAVAWSVAAIALAAGAGVSAVVFAVLPGPAIVFWSRQVVIVAGRWIVTFWPPERFRRDLPLTFAVRDTRRAWIIEMEGAGPTREIMRVPSSSPWWTSDDRMRSQVTAATERLRTACEA